MNYVKIILKVITTPKASPLNFTGKESAMIMADEITEKMTQGHFAPASARFAPGWPGIPARWTSSALRDGRVFDLPPQTVQRYITENNVCPRTVRRFNHKIRTIPSGKMLRVETLAPAIVHWSDDDWQTVQDAKTIDSALGIHHADLLTTALPDGKQVLFTFYWPQADHWENGNFTVSVSVKAQESIRIY